MGKRNSAAAAAKLTAAEAKVALAARRACTAAARATHAARVAKATAAAATLAARVYVPTKARPYVAPVDVSAARNVVRLARAASLCAVKAMRAIHMADARIATIEAATATCAAATATCAAATATCAAATATCAAATTTCAAATTSTTRAATTANARATRALMVAFLAQTPCLAALWFYATLDVADKAAAKEVAKAANKVHASIRAPRVPLNDATKRASITLACANARASKADRAAADASAIVLFGSVMSQRTIDARAEQGAAQREANAARKAAHKEIKALERSIMGVTPVVQVRVVRPIVAKLQGAHATDMARRHVVVDKKAFYPEAAGFRTSPLHPVMAPKTAANAAKREAAEKAAALVAARKAAKKMSRQEWELQKAHRLALKEQYMALRAAKVNRICTEVWYKHGIWVDTFLVRACNDSDHNTRVAAMTELLALRGVAA